MLGVTDPAPYPPLDGTQECAHVPDRDIFFPEVGWSQVRTQAALDACNRCAFLRPCLAYALTHYERGIWGGTTEQTRAAIRAELLIDAVPASDTFRVLPRPLPDETDDLDDDLDDPDQLGDLSA